MTTETSNRLTDVRVLVWLDEGAVRHLVLLRDRDAGALRRTLNITLGLALAPADLDRHATGIASALTQAINHTG